MKKILMLAVLGLFVSAASGLAQTIYDGAKLTGKDLNGTARFVGMGRSEEHTSELQSLTNIVCGVLLEKKKKVGCGGGCVKGRHE